MSEREPRLVNPNPEKPEALPTSDLQTAFANISAETLPRKGAIEYKKEVVSEVRENSLLSEEVLRQHPTVYVGSGTGVEYPLTLGSRDLIMVDPVLGDEEARKTVVERITRITGEQPTQLAENEYSFAFDFGSGDEQVRVKLESAIYGSPEEVAPTLGGEETEEQALQRLNQQLEENPDDPFIAPQVREEFRKKVGRFAPDYAPPKKKLIPRFQPPEKIGVLLGFRTTGVDLDSDPEAMEKLAPGGYVLVDNVFSSFLQQASDEEKQQHLYRGSPKPAIELLQQKYAERGFDFIELKSQQGSYQYTFIRKK